ncbi:MAG: ComEC/Rec2 family competence protein [Rhodobiaceae bacterium]
MRLIPERRILLYVGAMMGGVALAIIWRDLLASPGIAGILVISCLIAVIAGLRPTSERLARWQPVTLCVAWCLAGILSSLLQVSQLPSGLADRAARVEVTGMIEHVDGRFDGRLRMWLRVSETNRGPQDIAGRIRGHIVRLSVRPDEIVPRAGERARVVARIYPPPARVLHGAPDYSLRARASDVVASGYVTGWRAAGRDGQEDGGWATRLSAFRQARADRIAGSMTAPAGGIAAALLIGDRRYVSEATYDLFRGSGLAHLLAISGLHMGLLCFGLIACLRGLAALVPSIACRVPVHKFAAVAGVSAGLGYVILSGLSISAIRAFLMAMLILAAWLIDRLGLTVRNVGLAAGAILLVSPLALFSAGFQLSFAATAALVIWFESWRGQTSPGGTIGRAGRWLTDLVTASLIASAATLPLTAYHFGAIAPWGVAANLLGIPLTGLWIMPAGLAVLITTALPVPVLVHKAALLVMQTGIDALVTVASWFESLPASPWPVTPPSPPLLIVGYAGLGLLLCVAGRKRLKLAGGACLVCGLTVWLVMRPPVDGILFARGQAVHLVLPAEKGAAVAFTARGGRPLSDFLADNAARSLARNIDERTRRRHLALFQQRDRAQIAIVTSRGLLGAACRGPASPVIATVRADYPCRDGTPLFSLAALPPDNYLLRITQNFVRARASNGQYFLINPVRRP